MQDSVDKLLTILEVLRAQEEDIIRRLRTVDISEAYELVVLEEEDERRVEERHGEPTTTTSACNR
jgi:hypothetical protein